MGRFNLFSRIPRGEKELDGAMRHRKRLGGVRPNNTAGAAVGGIVVLGTLIGMLGSLHAQSSADDVAAQVRSQGYRCGQPVTAKRDVRLSKPDSVVWILKCRNATYRVRLDPDMAAHIVKLKNKR